MIVILHCVMGHLELNGFMATRGHFMEHGMDSNVFDKFERVILDTTI